MQLTTSDNARCHAGMPRLPPGTDKPAAQTPDSDLPLEPPGNPIRDGRSNTQRHAPQQCAPTRSHHSAVRWHTASSQPNITKALAKQNKSNMCSGHKCGSGFSTPPACSSNIPAHRLCQSILASISHVPETHVKRIRWYPEGPYAILGGVDRRGKGWRQRKATRAERRVG